VLGAESELAQRLAKRAGAAQELSAELSRIAGLPASEAAKPTDLGALLRDVAATAEGRAARHAVRLRLDGPDNLVRTTRPETLSALIRMLIDHAIAATPQGGEVRVRLSGRGEGFELGVSDGGPVVPAASRGELLRRRVDPTGLGRPEGLSLLVADAAAPVLGGVLSLGETPDGRSEVVLDV
jgi:two-component system sensor histidine kinase QseC